MHHARFAIAMVATLMACSSNGGMNPPPPADAPAATCTAITGNYSATGTQQTGSTCDPSMSTIDGAVAVMSDTSGFTAAFMIGSIDYSCNGVLTGCRWDATCTGTAPDGSSVRGMLTFTFTNTSFSGTLTEDFTGATNCHNQFAVTGTRS